MAKHNKLGAKGEAYAKDYLIKRGYVILEQNWRFSRAEIDIICKIDGILVFVEVKTLSYNYFGDPETAVDERKEFLIMDAANRYMEKINYDWEIRFDIISLIVDKNGGFKIKHFEDAFF